MWLAYGTLFDFGYPPQIPEPFKHTCHLFYAARIIDIPDDKPKWLGHKNKSSLMKKCLNDIKGKFHSSLQIGPNCHH